MHVGVDGTGCPLVLAFRTGQDKAGVFGEVAEMLATLDAGGAADAHVVADRHEDGLEPAGDQAEVGRAGELVLIRMMVQR